MNDGLWEWTEDVYMKEGYAVHKRNNPIHTGDLNYQLLRGSFSRVQRGGGHDRGNPFTICSRRKHDIPIFKGFFVGFRLIRTP